MTALAKTIIFAMMNTKESILPVILSSLAVLLCCGHLYAGERQPRRAGDDNSVMNPSLATMISGEEFKMCHVPSPYSIQYYALGVNKGKVYVAFTEDRRQLNPNISKGNISVSAIKLFR